MFAKILIANRGEISCRVLRTCRRLGIASVAVYSDADSNARHVVLADEALRIGPAPARQSYLNSGAIIDAAQRSGAQAIHPGYGFLSENADFADACAAAGIVFIGPPASAIRAMGSKAGAKTLMQQAGVPLVPGYHGAAQDDATLTGAAAAIGYPVLIKASAGGGGKGMRVADTETALPDALAGARREATSSFGDDRLLIEKYLSRPRHIEIQVFADTHGNCVHLFERDCSIQRRHQKVIEEAPAPHLSADRRAQMGAAAIAACRAVGYVGAGTVEFIAEDDRFYFMEMNTRLQVEHPVTEMITGQELVEWQLRVAAGEPLPRTQDELSITGHAIEARIYAEDPTQDFRPSIGRITHLRTPRHGPGVRIDSGVGAGDEITPYYDPMIAKLIVHGADRTEAVARLRRALGDYEVVGVRTNLPLLRAIAAEADFAAAAFDTGFIARHPGLLAPPPADADDLALAAAVALLRTAGAHAGADPWDATDAWRLNLPAREIVHLREGDISYAIACTLAADGALHADLPTGPAAVTLAPGRNDTYRITLGGRTQRRRILRDGAAVIVLHDGAARRFDPVDPLVPPARTTLGAATDLRAPLPARVVRVLAAAGDAVRAGQVLVVIEAMKMEMSLTAPADATVARVHVQADQMVREDADLVTFS